MRSTRAPTACASPRPDRARRLWTDRRAWWPRRPRSTGCSARTNRCSLQLPSATGGTEITTPLEPWIHDLRTTATSTDLWPWLLVLALILWPLDIALRRVMIGRREFVAAGGWLRALPRRRQATAARTATSESMLATRGRATSSETRAALRRTPEASATASVGNPHVAVEVDTGAIAAGGPATPTPTATVVPAPAPSASPAATATPPGSASDDTLARLRDAKRRARER